MLEQYKGLPKPVYIIVLANIINSLGTFVRPLMALFLTDKLNYSTSNAGFIIMLASLLYIPGSLIGGKLADMFGRKQIIIISSVISAFSLLMCAKFFIPTAFIGLVLFASFSQAVAQPAIGAIMIDMTNSNNRKAAFSLSYLGSNIGFSLGPIIAGFLYKNYLQLTFVVDGLTTLAFVVLIAKFTPKVTQGFENEAVLGEKEQPVKGSTLSALFKRPILLAFALIQVLLSFVYSQFYFALPLRLNQLFNENGAQVYGTLASVNGVTVLALTTIVISATSRFKTIYNMSLVGVLYAIGFGMLYFINSLPLLMISTLIWTLGEILSAVNARVFVADNTPASHRGRFNATINIISGTGLTVGPWVTGLLLKTMSLESVWLVIFVISLIAASLMYILHFIENRSTILEKSRASDA